MNYSKALNECIESAYMVAGHFGARYLESWHLLIAMSNHSYSVAGATLNDYPYEMDRLEEVALELKRTIAKTKPLRNYPFPIVWRFSLQKQSMWPQWSILRC